MKQVPVAGSACGSGAPKIEPDIFIGVCFTTHYTLLIAFHRVVLPNTAYLFIYLYIFCNIYHLNS
jgi:hypothetical protein